MHKAIMASIDFLRETQGLDFFDGLALSSIGVDFEVTQVVDNTKGIHAMIPKSYFKNNSAASYWYKEETKAYVATPE